MSLDKKPGEAEAVADCVPAVFVEGGIKHTLSLSPSEYYQILQARKLKKVDNEPNLDFASLTTKNEDLRQSNQFIVSEHNLSQSVEHLKIADEDSSGQEDKETTKSNKSAANSANGKTLGNKRVHKFRKPLIQSASENIILQENRIDLQSTKTDLTLANSKEIFEKSFNQSENSSNKVSLESSTSTTTHRKLKRGTNSILPDTEFKVPKPKVDKVQIDSKRTARDTRQATKLNGRSKNQQSIDDLNSNPPEKKSENEILPVDENSKSIKEITPNNYKPTKDSAKSVLENRSMNAADKIEQPKEKRLKLQLEKLSIKDEFELKEDSAIATKLSENIEQPEVLSIPEDVEVKEVEEDSIVVANLSQSVVKLERHTDLTKPKREDRRRSLPTKISNMDFEPTVKKVGKRLSENSRRSTSISSSSGRSSVSRRSLSHSSKDRLSTSQKDKNKVVKRRKSKKEQQRPSIVRKNHRPDFYENIDKKMTDTINSSLAISSRYISMKDEVTFTGKIAGKRFLDGQIFFLIRWSPLHVMHDEWIERPINASHLKKVIPVKNLTIAQRHLLFRFTEPIRETKAPRKPVIEHPSREKFVKEASLDSGYSGISLKDFNNQDLEDKSESSSNSDINDDSSDSKDLYRHHHRIDANIELNNNLNEMVKLEKVPLEESGKRKRSSNDCTELQPSRKSSRLFNQTYPRENSYGSDYKY